MSTPSVPLKSPTNKTPPIEGANEEEIVSEEIPGLLRPFRLQRRYTDMTPGSVLVEMGRTRVLCTASFDDRIPPWLRGQETGWVTAEYSMLPGSSSPRIRREQYNRGRALEISRLIGRSLRAVIDLDQLGEQMIRVDCDVLQADGGTRTASINGGWMALWDACVWGISQGWWSENPVQKILGAISVGIVNGLIYSDLNYEQDSMASVDLNVVMTDGGGLVEVQGTAESESFDRDQLNRMLDLAQRGIDQVLEVQQGLLHDDA